MEKKDLQMVFLDLANAFGSVPHEILWTVFNFFEVPNDIIRLVKAYFQDLQFRATVQQSTIAWQHLKVGIIVGCTISLLSLTMTMELIMEHLDECLELESKQMGCAFPNQDIYG